MKLFLRFFFLLITAFKRDRCEARGPCISSFRVYPNDLDLNGHVNNGVYLTYADLGRFDLLLRAGYFRKILNHGWYPVVVAETVRFYKSLKLFQRFTIETEVIGWDEKNVLIQQRFERNGQLLALAVVNARFLTPKGGSVTTTELLAFLEISEASRPLPEWIEEWRSAVEKADSLLRNTA